MNVQALACAVKALNGEAFKLWCYLNKNQNGYTFNLSKQDALSFGLGSESSYNRAVKALIDKGYLIKVNDLYMFNEYIQSK